MNEPKSNNQSRTVESHAQPEDYKHPTMTHKKIVQLFKTYNDRGKEGEVNKMINDGWTVKFMSCSTVGMHGHTQVLHVL